MRVNPAIVPENEAERLAAVYRYDILETPADGHFDAITSLAAGIFNVPMSIVSIVDKDRIWFKSRCGVGATEVPRDPGLCASAITQDDLYVLNDTRLDPHALANPLVAGELGIRFYAGAPLTTADGYNLGTICILDREPRDLTSDDLAILKQLAGLVVRELELRIATRQIVERERRFNEQLEAEVEARREQLLAVQSRLIEKERLAAIGEFASSIVHDIRSPLSTIQLALEYFDKANQDERSRKRLTLAISETNRLQALLNEILLYAKPQKLELVSVALDNLVEEALTTVSDQTGLGEDKFNRKIVTGCRVKGDADKLKQVLINVLTNACEAGGTEPVLLSVHPDTDRSMIIVEVTNGGKSIPPMVLERITEPFVTTKTGGSGLGLAIVRRIVEAHRGRLQVASSAEQGTRVQIRLPSASAVD